VSQGSAQRDLRYLLSYYVNLPFVYPEFASIGVTIGCCAKCRLCSHWKVSFQLEDELTLTEIKGVIDQLERMRVNQLDLTGGEPLMRRAVTIEAARYASERGFEVFLTTNAIPLNDETARDLVCAGVNYFNLSLDGAKLDTHDYIRGVDGCYEKVLSAVDHLKKHRADERANAMISFTTIINDATLEELPDVVRMVDDCRIDGVTFNPYVIDNYHWAGADYDEDEFWVPSTRIPVAREVAAELISLKAGGGKIHNPIEVLEQVPMYFEQKERFDPGVCLSGYRYLYINSFGFVDICAKGPKLNVRVMPLRSIWRSMRFFHTRWKVRHCRVPCLYSCFKRVSFSEVLPWKQKQNA